MSGGAGWRYLLAFAVGNLLAAAVPNLPGWPLLLALAAAAGLCAALPRLRLAGCLLLGSLWFLAHAQAQLAGHWPRERAGEVASLVGTVASLPRQGERSTRFVFDVDRAGSPSQAPARVRVSWYRASAHLEPGSRWRLPLRLEPPHGRDNPDGFDYQRYLLTRRIDALATVVGEPVRLDGAAPLAWFDRQRLRLAEILQAETVDRDVAALKRALAVADRSALRPELGDRLRATGTAHLLAISGLHVGMVAGVAGLVGGALSMLLLPLCPRLDRRRAGVAIGLAAAAAYAALAGFTLPTRRALIMLSILALALASRRVLAPAQALLLALVAVLLLDPMAPLATGFWLSFSAVAVLVWAFSWRPGRSGSRLEGLVRAQVVVMIGLLPLSVGVFGQFAPGALPANLVAIPLVGLVVLPALLLEVAAILAGLPGGPVAGLASIGLSVLLDFIAWIDQLPLSRIALPPVGVGAMVCAALGALWLTAPPAWPARWLGALLLLPLVLPPRADLEPGVLEAWFLDVGNGLSVLVRTREQSLLYDTGPGDGEGSDVIGRALPALLSRLRAPPPSRVVVSHGRGGHAGGLASVQAVAPEAVVHSSVAGVGDRCHPGIAWQSGRWRFRFLHPSRGLPYLSGNSSCVLFIEGPGGALLLTGAIDSDVEARLVDLHGGPPASVLQLPAAGHRSGASAAFLDAVDPGVAIVSSARFDRFDRPHAEVLTRLDTRDIESMSTARCGALRVRLRPGRAVAVDSMATLSPRFWRPRAGCRLDSRAATAAVQTRYHARWSQQPE